MLMNRYSRDADTHTMPAIATVAGNPIAPMRNGYRKNAAPAALLR